MFLQVEVLGGFIGALFIVALHANADRLAWVFWLVKSTFLLLWWIFSFKQLVRIVLNLHGKVFVSRTLKRCLWRQAQLKQSILCKDLVAKGSACLLPLWRCLWVWFRAYRRPIFIFYFSGLSCDLLFFLALQREIKLKSLAIDLDGLPGRKELLKSCHVGNCHRFTLLSLISSTVFLLTLLKIFTFWRAKLPRVRVALSMRLLHYLILALFTL